MLGEGQLEAHTWYFDVQRESSPSVEQSPQHLFENVTKLIE